MIFEPPLAAFRTHQPRLIAIWLEFLLLLVLFKPLHFLLLSLPPVLIIHHALYAWLNVFPAFLSWEGAWMMGDASESGVQGRGLVRAEGLVHGRFVIQHQFLRGRFGAQSILKSHNLPTGLWRIEQVRRARLGLSYVKPGSDYSHDLRLIGFRSTHEAILHYHCAATPFSLLIPLAHY